MKEKNELAKFLINMLRGIDNSLHVQRTIIAPYSFMESQTETLRMEARNDLKKFENVMNSFIDTFLGDEKKLGEWIEKHAEDFMNIESLCSKVLVKEYLQHFKVKRTKVL